MSAGSMAEEMWHRVQVTGAECERIGRRVSGKKSGGRWGATWFAQEYQCCFTDNGAGMFGWDLLERALVDGVEPLNVGPWDWGG